MALKSLNNKHLKAIHLLVYSDKLKQEIAQECGVSATTFSTWYSDPLFQEGIREEMHRGFNHMALKARKKLDELVDCNNPQVALAAAKDVLSKAGYDAPEKIEQTTTIKSIEIEIVE